MKQFVVLTVIAVTLAGASTARAVSKMAQYRSNTDALISNTWHLQRVMGVRFTPTNRSYLRDTSPAYVKWVYKHWKRVHWQTMLVFKSPPHYSQFICIHGYEGSWTDTGSPYWGGLQMDLGFQNTYGGYLLKLKGTADHWTPLEQIWTAEKAEASRGFWPWPNTARYCGLL